MSVLMHIDTVFGVSVRTVSLFILYIYLITSVINILTYSLSKVTPAERNEIVNYVYDQLDPRTPNRQEVAESYADTIIRIHNTFKIIRFVGLIIVVVVIVSCLYGVHTYTAGYMIPYLIYSGISLILIAITSVILLLMLLFFAIAFINAQPALILVFIIVMLVTVLLLAFEFYVFLIFYNCYRLINENAAGYTAE